MEQLASILAPVATTIAAFIVAANFGSRITGYGFIVFTVGSVSWAFLGMLTDQPNLLWQNILLTLLNVFGIWRWLGRQAKIEEGADAAAEDSRRTPGEDLFPLSLLMKAPVRSQRGSGLGRTVDAMAGCSSGRIEYLVVSEGGVAGVGETLRQLPWRDCHVHEHRVVTRMEDESFNALKPIEPDHWPAR